MILIFLMLLFSLGPAQPFNGSALVVLFVFSGTSSALTQATDHQIGVTGQKEDTVDAPSEEKKQAFPAMLCCL